MTPRAGTAGTGEAWRSPTWTLSKARLHGQWIATQRANWQSLCAEAACDLAGKRHRVVEHIDSVDEHVEGLLALVDRMLDRIAHARAAIIIGEAGALDQLNAAVSDANGEDALLRELEGA